MFEPLFAYLIALLAGVSRSAGSSSTLRIPSLLDRIESTDRRSKVRFAAYSYASRALVLLLGSIIVGILVDLSMDSRSSYIDIAAGALALAWGVYMVYDAYRQRMKFRAVTYSETGFKYMEPKYEAIAEYEGPIVSALASLSKGLAEKGRVVMYWGLITGILSLLGATIIESSFTTAYVATLLPGAYTIPLAMSGALTYSTGAILPVIIVERATGGAQGRLPTFMLLNRLKFASSMGAIAVGILLAASFFSSAF